MELTGSADRGARTLTRSHTGEMEAGPIDTDDAYWTRYGEPIDLDNPNDSRAIVLGLVGSGTQHILELGCSAGYMTKVMHERGHAVTAVEIDPVAAELAAPFAERLLVGDLDHVAEDGRHLFDELDGTLFDTLIAADVLEHLRNPDECLRRALEFLADDGTVILSIPNVAHGDIRLALLGGQFNYADHGLLDRTHVQLFTLESLLAMIRDAGLAPVRWQRSFRAMGDTEVEIDEDLLEFGRRVLADDAEAETYQWIVTCRRSAQVGQDAVWPQSQRRNVAAARVVEMMNQPVAHPGTAHPGTTQPATGNPACMARSNDTSTALDVATPTSAVSSLAGATTRRLRRVASIGRGRMASLLSR